MGVEEEEEEPRACREGSVGVALEDWFACEEEECVDSGWLVAELTDEDRLGLPSLPFIPG